MFRLEVVQPTYLVVCSLQTVEVETTFLICVLVGVARVIVTGGITEIPLYTVTVAGSGVTVVVVSVSAVNSLAFIT